MQPAFFCVLKFSILKLKRKKKLKKKGIKEMNNGYEHMEEKTQDGVCFQWDESHEDILDMNVEAGIKIVEFPSNIRIPKTEKTFPDVKELVISKNSYTEYSFSECQKGYFSQFIFCVWEISC